MNKFVTAQGWYEPDSPKPQTLRNLAVSLSLETAEVLEHFQWKEEEIDKGDFAPPQKPKYTHEGSIGNLCLENISDEMQRVINQFNFIKVEEAIKRLIEGAD